jgi:hypothetical protein
MRTIPIATAPDLFTQAANLIEQGLLKLKTTSVPCPHCSTLLNENREHWRVYDQLASLPERLRAAALKIEKASDPPVQSKGYVVARRWFLEKGEQGPSLTAELERVLRVARADCGGESDLSDVDELLRVIGGGK